MDGLRRLIFAVIIVAVLSLMPSLADTPPTQPPADSTDETLRAGVLEAYGKLPVLFIQNDGQLDDRVEYYVKAAGQTLYFTDDGIVFDLVRYGGDKEQDLADRQAERLVFSIDFLGASERPLIEAGDKDEAVVNYFIGNNPDEWHSDILTYQQLVYGEIYPGIDLRLYGRGGVLEYEFVVEPGASVADIALACSGTDGLAIEDGELVVSTAFGDMGQTQPYLYQEIGGETVEVDGGFRLVDDSTYGFEAAAYDAGYPLIIDPSLAYSTYLGGGSDDHGQGIAVDGSGCAYITGRTFSNNFPTSNPYQGMHGGLWDVFVTKLSVAGNALTYSTYLGGGSDDCGRGIVVDGAGCAYVTGETWSADFPTNNPYQGDQGAIDAFVTKLSASGNVTAYSTYLGGSSDDYGGGIAVDGSGCAYVTGQTFSNNFPISNPYQATNAGGYDAFVTKLSASGNVTAYSTYLGGGNRDGGYGIAVDGAGGAYIAGETWSADFPTSNPYQGDQGAIDAFVTKLSASGNVTAYSTYLGGSDSDSGKGIAVDGAGGAYITGLTDSTDFPINNQYQGDQGGSDAFVTKLSASGNATAYSTYLGGSNGDVAIGIAVDGSGCAYIAGETLSTDFPTNNPYQDAFQGGLWDVFVTKLSASGNATAYSTYLGGSGNDSGKGIVVDGAGCAYITGETNSTNFPTSNPYQGALSGTSDAFVTKLGGVDITVAPTSINFGSVAVSSSSAPQTVTITNSPVAIENLDVGAITIGGVDATHFSIQNDNCSGQPIAAGASATLQVVFTPTSAGARAATLQIPSNDPDDAAVNVTLSGSGVPLLYSGVIPQRYLQINLLGTSLRCLTSSGGCFQETANATSADGLLTINIPQGTVARDKDGGRLGTFNVTVNENPPPPPPGANIIGLPYDFEPDGATFAPPITLTFNYDPASIPEGVAEEGLVLAYYDENTGQWVQCECTCDPATHCITASISHFSCFALIAHAAAPTAPAPATFSLSNLSIQPAQVHPGEAVTITLSVANTGDMEGSYVVILKVNGVKEAGKSVTIAAGSSQEVSFSVTQEKAGSYSIVVAELSGSFTVVAPAPPAPPPPPAINWPVLGGIIAAVVVGVLVYIFIRRRRAY